MFSKISKVLGIAGLALFVASCSVRPVHAQGPTYTIPQSVQATLASNVTCTGALQTFSTSSSILNGVGFRNLGQTQHVAILSPGASVTHATLQISGADTTGTIANISDVAQGSGLSGGIAVTGNGSYPNIQVQVVCLPVTATFSLTYSGSSSSPNPTAGTFLNTQIDKMLFEGIAGNTNQTAVFTTPFGSSSGNIAFSYNSSAVAGSTLSIQCGGNFLTNFRTYLVSIANNVLTQTFPVPAMTCPTATVTYTSGGAAGNINIEYLFDQPGQQPTTLGPYTHITGTTATVIKAGPGTLLSVVVNTPAAGTISVFDLAAASCTGTPATNVVAVITATATAPLGTLSYNMPLTNGICVKASVAMDITVSAQ